MMKFTNKPISNPRLSFINREKDFESSLGDFGVRKYEDGLGRFTTCDPLFEKYYGWSPYVYSANNPVSLYDNNGKWALEVSDLSHAYSGTVHWNKIGYLGSQLNDRIYKEWTVVAPKFANYLKNNSIFVTQSELPENVNAQATVEADIATPTEISGNKITFDLGKQNAYDELAGNALHEMAHLQGYGEFAAYCVMLGAGYKYAEKNILGLLYQKPWIIIQYKYGKSGEFKKQQELWDLFLSGASNSEILNFMKTYGESIIK